MRGWWLVVVAGLIALSTLPAGAGWFSDAWPPARAKSLPEWIAP